MPDEFICFGFFSLWESITKLVADEKRGEDAVVSVGWSVQLPVTAGAVWQGELRAPLAAQGLRATRAGRFAWSKALGGLVEGQGGRSEAS